MEYLEESKKTPEDLMIRVTRLKTKPENWDDKNLNMTFKFGNPVSTEWDKIKEFVFRKEMIDVSCQEGKGDTTIKEI